MTRPAADAYTLLALDEPTRLLVRLAVVVATRGEREIRATLATARPGVPAAWIEELLLQTYLFAGFPRALNAMREWRRYQSGVVTEAASGDFDSRQNDGVATCAAVYGSMYDRLRENIRALHPLLDDWMITEGYGKVLSRPDLDLPRRELCIIAACAADGQDRQLHSHLHGALNVGVAPDVIEHTIEAVSDLLGNDRTLSARMLWDRVKGK